MHKRWAQGSGRVSTPSRQSFKMTRLTFILLALETFSAFGQCTNCEQSKAGRFCWGEKKSEAQEHLAKFMDFTRMATFSKGQHHIDEALIELGWVLDNAPCINICVYVGGERFINKMLNFHINVKIRTDCIETLKELNRLKEKHFGANAKSTVPCFYTEH